MKRDLGGIRFSVTGPGPSGEAAGQAAAETPCNRLAPLLIGKYGLRGIAYSGASFGPTVVDPRTVSVDATLRKADAAMYEVKRERKAQRA